MYLTPEIQSVGPSFESLRAHQQFQERLNLISLRDQIVGESRAGCGSQAHWTIKFKAKKLFRSVFGSTFGQAMLHTTMDGRERDER
jgi:hypothetical protein